MSIISTILVSIIIITIIAAVLINVVLKARRRSAAQAENEAMYEEIEFKEVAVLSTTENVSYNHGATSDNIK